MLHRFSEAVKDLAKAVEMSPANEKDVVAAKLKEAQDGAAKQPAAVETEPASLPSRSAPEQPSDRGNGTASSSSQHAANKNVEDGHVSDADSDNVEEIPSATAATSQQQAVRQPAPSMPAAPMGMPPGMDPAQMQNMMRDPGMMKQMADMMGSMDPAQMESMARMAGMPGQRSLSICSSLESCNVVAI